MNLLTRLFWIQFSVVAFVAIFHGSAEYFSWYYFMPRLDIPMHFLGGVWVALASYWFLRDVVGYTEHQKRLYVFLLLTVLFVGLLWEFFELFIRVIEIINVDMRDSFKDLVMDLLGGVLVCALVQKRWL